MTKDAQEAPTTTSNEVDERVDHAFDLENLPQNWGGVQENEYIKYLARSQVPAHILILQQEILRLQSFAG